MIEFMTDTNNEATETTAEKDEKALLREAYTAATQRLREEYREEFRSLHREEAEKRGVVWRPRLSAEEKARQQVLAILAEHPALRDELVAG